MHTPTEASEQPMLRVVTRPNDANPKGDIFGGWLMSQMDIAGAMAAKIRAKGPVVTVAVKDLLFIKPLFVYDLVSFYTEITAVGKTSITVKIDAYAVREMGTGITEKISEATYVYVAIDEPGKKRQVPQD